MEFTRSVPMLLLLSVESDRKTRVMQIGQSVKRGIIISRGDGSLLEQTRKLFPIVFPKRMRDIDFQNWPKKKIRLGRSFHGCHLHRTSRFQDKSSQCFHYVRNDNNNVRKKKILLQISLFAPFEFLTPTIFHATSIILLFLFF